MKGEGERILKDVSAEKIGQETILTHWAMESQKDLNVHFHRETHLYQRIF